MSSERQEEPATFSSEITRRPNDPAKRVAIYALILLITFLLGFGPMWMTARKRTRERDTALTTLRVSGLQNDVANAAIDARRGEYEPARKAASEFFTSLQTEIDRGRESIFSEAQRTGLRTLFDTRDDTITLLARSDPASAERLSDLYVKYRAAIGK